MMSSGTLGARRITMERLENGEEGSGNLAFWRAEVGEVIS
jgi:hypothetical protein